MKHDLFIKRTIFIAALVLFPLLLPVGSFAAELAKGTRALQIEGLKQHAVESVQDTLKACLDRIPQDASFGQRLLAEQNCQQKEVEWKRSALTF